MKLGYNKGKKITILLEKISVHPNLTKSAQKQLFPKMFWHKLTKRHFLAKISVFYLRFIMKWKKLNGASSIFIRNTCLFDFTCNTW